MPKQNSGDFSAIPVGLDARSLHTGSPSPLPHSPKPKQRNRPMSEISGLGKLLRERREARNVSLSVAASGIGTTKAHLYEMEIGTANNPTLKTIVHLMGYYNISFSQILNAWEP